MKIKTRKMLFLSTIISRGTQPRKDDNDGIEVGAGFADAAARANSGDTRTVIPTPTPAPAASEPADNEADDGDEDDGEGEEGDDGGQGEGDENEATPKRKTSKFIRDLKAERREDRRKIEILEGLLYKKETEGLPGNRGDDNPPNHEGITPDPNDAAKYPLGVLDDRYVEDKIQWQAKKTVREILDGERQTARTQQTAAAETERVQGLKIKIEELTDKGSELFDDFEDKVLEGGMKGSWELSEPTFHAAAEAPHGARILHDLASDKAEASRVAKLSPFQQAKYVLEKDAAYEAKLPKPRTKPAAEDVPQNLPRGRNSSNPIRPDTDNLNDFRKVWYANK